MANSTILVTGASGFIAKHVVREALSRGYAVRASVRSRVQGEAVRAAVLPHLADTSATGRLSFAELTLTGDDGWDQAMEGVDALIHTASPFPIVQPRDRDDLVRPAVEGTLRALGSAHRAGIGRVVITSSIAAVVNTDLPPGRSVYDERDWSDPEGPKCNAYSASKTRAERAAWDFVAREAPDLKLTAINPGFVLGPGLDDRMGTSLGVVARLLTGKDPLVPRVGYPVVDVRDVARLHVAALETPASEGQRVLAADRFMSFPEMARALKQTFPDRRVVTREAPDWLIRLLARFDRSIGTIVPDLGRRMDVSADRARALFGISFIPACDALLASSRMLIDRRLV